MAVECKTCQAPDKIRDLIERMRTAGISYRDCALAVKAIRVYDISHAAIQRHEVEGHFSPQAIISNTSPLVEVENLSMKTIVDRKLQLWWNNGGKDQIPDGAEVRQWLKLWADIRHAEDELEEKRELRAMFKPAPIAIAAKVVEVENDTSRQ